MHTVLEPSVVIDRLPVNVACVAPWGSDRLVLGCTEGALLGETDTPSGTTATDTSAVRRVRRWTRRGSTRENHSPPRAASESF